MIPQIEAIQQLKAELSSHRVLTSYSLSTETCVAADASSFGLGGVLSQKQADETWKLVVIISRGPSLRHKNIMHK